MQTQGKLISIRKETKGHIYVEFEILNLAVLEKDDEEDIIIMNYEQILDNMTVGKIALLDFKIGN